MPLSQGRPATASTWAQHWDAPVALSPCRPLAHLLPWFSLQIDPSHLRLTSRGPSACPEGHFSGMMGVHLVWCLLPKMMFLRPTSTVRSCSLSVLIVRRWNVVEECHSQRVCERLRSLQVGGSLGNFRCAWAGRAGAPSSERWALCLPLRGDARLCLTGVSRALLEGWAHSCFLSNDQEPAAPRPHPHWALLAFPVLAALLVCSEQVPGSQ